MIPLAAPPALLLVFAAGWGITHLFRLQLQNPAERFALAWLYGGGAVSLLLFVAGFIASGRLLVAIVSIVCLSIAAVACLRREVSWARPARSQMSAGRMALLLLVAAETATIATVSFRHTLGWDGLLNWEIKARYAWLNGGSVPSVYYSDPSRVFSHPEYPLAIPNLELWLYLWLGEANQFWAKLVFVLFFIAGTILLLRIIAELCQNQTIALVVTAFYSLLPCLIDGFGGVVVGYVDFPIAICYLAAVGYLLRFAQTRALSALRSCSLALLLLPWFKREGLILWLIGAVLAAAVLLTQRAPLRRYLWLLPGMVLALTWRGYITSLHVLASADFLPLNYSAITIGFSRLIPVAQEVALELVRLREWSIFWIVALPCICCMAALARDKVALCLCGGLVVPLIIFSGVYCFSAWPDYLLHIANSLPRLLLQLMPVAWLGVALALARSTTAAEPERAADLQ
jgi:hypothetical protein